MDPLQGQKSKNRDKKSILAGITYFDISINVASFHKNFFLLLTMKPHTYLWNPFLVLTWPGHPNFPLKFPLFFNLHPSHSHHMQESWLAIWGTKNEFSQDVGSSSFSCYYSSYSARSPVHQHMNPTRQNWFFYVKGRICKNDKLARSNILHSEVALWMMKRHNDKESLFSPAIC